MELEYHPPIQLSEISNLDRDGTLRLLSEVGKIAEKLERKKTELNQIKQEILQETQLALKAGAKKPRIVYIIPTILAILAFVLTIAEFTFIGGIIMSAMLWAFFFWIASSVDSIFNEKAHLEKAEEYRVEHVVPLLKRAEEKQDEISNYMGGRNINGLLT